MTNKKMDPLFTEFATAEKDSHEEMTRQAHEFEKIPRITEILDAVQTAILVLNKNRQIVFANKVFLSLVANPSKPVLGQRPGNAIGCVNAESNPGGCGTTKFCGVCGAVNTILSSIQGKVDNQECQIRTTEDNEALDLMTMSVPFKSGDTNLNIFSITDISHEKRRRVLERVFFHDIMNTAGGLKGFSELLIDSGLEQLDEYKKIIHDLSENLIDEIDAQRQLISAENNELPVNNDTIKTLDILKEIRLLYMNHQIAKQKEIKILDDTHNIEFETDHVLLSRVLGNTVKNALEASKVGGCVSLNCQSTKDYIQFIVNNQTTMPEKVKLQIFNRSFSTKGIGRGIGTYSIKLITEGYLKGIVDFESTEERGTTFTIQLPL
jgi:nitrogen-specific signal transduction histidine kinase